MSIDLSSINSSISNLVGRYSKSVDLSGKEPKNINDLIRSRANELMSNRKGLADYIGKKDSFTYSSNRNSSSNLESALSYMKTTTGMSAIEKYKYIMEQGKNGNAIDTSEPDPEKLLSKSEKIIQRALTQGLGETDSLKLSQALQAKQIALSRLNIVG